METIGVSKIWTYLGQGHSSRTATCLQIRRARPHHVGSYMELAQKIAELQFRNRSIVLMFRGQSHDVCGTNGTTIRPSILRSRSGLTTPGRNTLARRYNVLERSENLLVEHYAMSGFAEPELLARQRILRWAILQHYEICPTPLLDVTHSLRIAASFACHAGTPTAMLYVLGIPNISGAVTASAEAGLQIVRLASVCPPAAVRPHIQEGYLLGEYPELLVADQKQLYASYEIDFGRRLIAKFSFEPRQFWQASPHFPQVVPDALYPGPALDPLCMLADTVKSQLAPLRFPRSAFVPSQG